MFSKLKELFKLGKSDSKIRSADQPKRYNDAVLIVRQDNETNSLLVEASNFLALKLLGCETDDIVEKDLRVFLPEHISQIIDENVQFSDNGKCVDDVLNRVANFKIRSKDGTEIPLKIRVIRSLSSSAASPRFQVVMNDSSLIESLEAHRQNYRANMRGDEIYDKTTGLPSRDSVVKDLEIISFYTERSLKESCYAIFKFINYDDLRIEHGDDGAAKILQNLIKTLETTKRGQDMLGVVAEGAVILIFPETPKENVKIPISRIHAKLPPEIKSEVRIYYNAIKSGVSPEEQLSSCLKGMCGTF